MQQVLKWRRKVDGDKLSTSTSTPV